MKTAIVQKDEPVLREVAQEVAPEEFGTAELTETLRAMSAALHAEDDGVAIAAPQIGVSKRIFVVSGRTLGMLKSGKSYDDLASEDILPDKVYINPVILKLSKKREMLEEGCLSVRWLYGKVSRSEKARIWAQDESGKSFTVDSSGLLAQIFQHETDHLNGILFTDFAIDLEDLPPTDHEHAEH